MAMMRWEPYPRPKGKIHMKKRWLIITSIFILFALSGCFGKSSNNNTSMPITDLVHESESESLNDRDVKKEIDNYMLQFISAYSATGNLKIERYDYIFSDSSEGSEIKRYIENNGNVLRFRIIYYGETGKREDNYYLLNGYMYCTSLKEFYGGSITQTDAEVLYRTFDEGIMIGKNFYQLDTNTGKYIEKDNNIVFMNKNDLYSSFDKSVKTSTLNP